MHITLLRTGGFIPMTKKAEADVDWSREEMQRLLDIIKLKGDSAGQMRDATGYTLKTDAGTFPIDWERIPASHKNFFEKLKDDLKIMKPGST